MSHRNGFLLFLFSAAIVCLAFSGPVQPLVVGQVPEAASGKIRALLEEKRNILKQRLDGIESQYKSGLSSHDTLIAARNDFLDAELAMATDKAQRIVILEKKVTNAQEREKLMLEARRIGSLTVTPADALMATADRLDAEIALAREEES